MGFFHRCVGPPVAVVYAAPRSKFTIDRAPIDVFTRLHDEAVMGVTVVTYRCKKCGREFENRHLGDRRGDLGPDE